MDVIMRLRMRKNIRSGLAAGLAMSALLGASTLARPAAADDSGDGAPSHEEKRVPNREKPHTLASLEGGVIALPNAPISTTQRGGDTPFGQIGAGDATLNVGVRLLYRASPWFAFGAGAGYGPSPTSDDQYGGKSGIKRTHSRSYLTLSAEARVIPLRYGDFEGWAGALVGGVVVLDRFKTDTGVSGPSFLGEKEVTMRTEGITIGVEVGGSYYFGESWSIGVTGRGHEWFLPDTPRCSPIGDCATLSGNVQAYELALALSYHIPL